MGCTGSTTMLKDANNDNRAYEPLITEKEKSMVEEKTPQHEAGRPKHEGDGHSKENHHHDKNKQGHEVQDGFVVIEEVEVHAETKIPENKPKNEEKPTHEQKNEEGVLRINKSVVNQHAPNMQDSVLQDKVINQMKSEVYNELTKDAIREMNSGMH